MGDKTRDIENKSIYFREVLGFLPFCHKAVTMTGQTAIDARQLAEAGKFGRETFITNYDTMLPSWSKGITTQVEFRRKWNGVMEGILGSGEDSRRMLFKDIFKSSLVEDAGHGNELVLADACCPYHMGIARWMGSGDTLEAIVKDGIIGVNTNLMKASLDGDSSPFSHGVKFLMRGCYSNDEEKYGILRKMHIIANDVENSAGGLLTTVAMLNYWDDPRSKMAYIFFRKTR
jgi:hypothetical protein